MSYRDNILDVSRLNLNGDFDQQVDQLLQRVRLSRREVEALADIFRDIEHAMNKCWKGSKVYPFGSIVTGLGIKTSDVDCFVQLPEWIKHKPLNPVNKAKNYFQNFPRMYGDVQAVPWAKVPIVKFYHLPAHRYCDINFKSYAGIRNSKLIAFLLHMDYRALPLAVIIKYWSKVHNLTGTNLMPNYTLTMLVIFYLQQANILPPVCDLQRNVQENIVENWNTAFQEDFQFESRNRESLYALLGGFFSFYKNFKFSEFVVSPFLGEAVPRSEFAQAESLPQEYWLYKSLVSNGVCEPMNLNPKICVQDPFEHARNCGAPIYDKLVVKLMHFITECAGKFGSVPKENYIEAILLNIPYQDLPPNKKKNNTVANNKNNTVANNPNNTVGNNPNNTVGKKKNKFVSVGKVVKAYKNTHPNLQKQKYSNAIHSLYFKYQRKVAQP